MGNFITYWYWCGDPDEKNEVSGMTLRDIYNVQKSWKPLYANVSGSGLLIFTRLFEADPETKTFFSFIATANKEEMAANVNFRAHLVNIMSAINATVENLHHPEIVIVMMHKLGRFHNYIKIKKKHFWVLRDVLVVILKNDMKLPPNVIASWGLFIEFIYEHIFTKLDE